MSPAFLPHLHCPSPVRSTSLVPQETDASRTRESPRLAYDTVLFHFGLLQPDAHLHLTVHRLGNGEVLPGLVQSSSAEAQCAESQVVVGDKRSHREGLG